MSEMRFTTFDGLSLAYDDTGAGMPLLCLAGLTRDARDFDDVAPHLPGDVRMIRLDSRGRGRSDWAKDPMNYQIPVEAQDALALLDHLGLEKAAILGTSRGGMIAMGLAFGAKDRLSGVILNDIGPELSQGGIARITDYIGIPPKGPDMEAVAAALKASMGDAFPTLSDADWLRCAQRWFRETEEGIGLTYDPALRDAVLASSASPMPDLWPFFDALRGIPVAAIRGENSDLLSADTLSRMQERNPEMIAATVPARGHCPFLDEPESLVAIEAFLDRLRS